MGQPERRRRRVRPSSASGGEATDAATVPAAAVPAPPVSTPSVPVPPVPVPGPPAAVPGPPPHPVPFPGRPPASGPPAVVTFEAGGARPATPESGGTDRGPQRPARGGYPRRGNGAAGGDDRESERGLRGLVGSGSSQVSVGAALRAREASRPSDGDLAEAEENLTIVRRNWLPREDLPRR